MHFCRVWSVDVSYAVRVFVGLLCREVNQQGPTSTSSDGCLRCASQPPNKRNDTPKETGRATRKERTPLCFSLTCLTPCQTCFGSLSPAPLEH